jgi:crotonobetaine/carnitine-CoA ligase
LNNLTVQERIRRIEAEPLPRNIGALLDEAADAVPGHTAWCFFSYEDAHTETIAYGELRQAVNRLANGLAAAGVGPGTHVGVMLPNAPAMPLTWLALARLGAVMIPVNTRYTGRELHYSLDDGGAEFLVVHDSSLEVLRAMPSPLPRLDGRVFVVGEVPSGYRDWAGVSAGQHATPPAVAEPTLETVLNLQYTSGTTGFPKGCILTQRYWLTCAKTYSAFDGLRIERILADNPFFYMTPQWLLLMAFLQRGTLFVGPRLSGSHWLESVRTHRIQYCLFREIYAEQPPTPHDAGTGLLRASIYPHRPENHAALEARFGCPIRPAFGMTEIGAGLIMPIEAGDMVGSGSCGLPAPFRECRIADSEGNTLPAGATGELQVRGPGILKGYYNKPEATAAAFHGEWFRTGDLARRDERGYYYIVGRIKDMIKRAGENVAANEVEAVLESLPGIAEAAVIGVPDTLRGEEIKACLVLAAGRSIEHLPPQAVFEHCQHSLAAFKIPRYLEYRSAPLPRTASGKVAKTQLRSERADLLANTWERVHGRWIYALHRHPATTLD